MPTVTRNRSVNWGTSATTLYYRVLDADGNDLITRTSTGVAERPAGSGVYQVKIATWNTDWVGSLVWDDGIEYAVEDFDPLTGETHNITAEISEVRGQ